MDKSQRKNSFTQECAMNLQREESEVMLLPVFLGSSKLSSQATKNWTFPMSATVQQALPSSHTHSSRVADRYVSSTLGSKQRFSSTGWRLPDDWYSCFKWVKLAVLPWWHAFLQREQGTQTGWALNWTKGGGEIWPLGKEQPGLWYVLSDRPACYSHDNHHRRIPDPLPPWRFHCCSIWQ
jgi:hypothetical protein